jgi:hypothetical protein
MSVSHTLQEFTKGERRAGDVAKKLSTCLECTSPGLHLQQPSAEKGERGSIKEGLLEE